MCNSLMNRSKYYLLINYKSYHNCMDVTHPTQGFTKLILGRMYLLIPLTVH